MEIEKGAEMKCEACELHPATWEITYPKAVVKVCDSCCQIAFTEGNVIESRMI